MTTIPLATFNMNDGGDDVDERYDIVRQEGYHAPNVVGYDTSFRVDNHRNLRQRAIDGTFNLIQREFDTFGEAIAFVLAQTGWGESTIAIESECFEDES